MHTIPCCRRPLSPSFAPSTHALIAQAEARLANRVHERAKKLLAVKQKWHQSLLVRGSEISKVR